LVTVQIYSESITPRLRYACRILFECALKVPFNLVDRVDSLSQDGAKIFYTCQISAKETGLQIVPSGLLEENGLRTKKPTVGWDGDIPKLFFNEQEKWECFDPFSAAFYMATRYEEYLPFRPDAYGRFPEFESLSGKNDFTHLPIVHIWAIRLGNALIKKHPAFSIPQQKATALFTYDIDVAYAYLGRSLTTQVLSLAKDLITIKFSAAAKKFTSRFGKKQDPSDTYKLLENNVLKTIFFFLLSENRTRFDRNISPKSPVLQQLIKRIAYSKQAIGIHPSYFSSEKPGLIQSEKKVLETIVNQQITISRQHFLRFRMPDTFRDLQNAGIKHDYSMQYPEMPGFRAGLCVPFPFFDLLENRETDLLLHPGCIMETTFRDDLHLNAAQTMDWYLDLWHQVQAVGGEFISIWHNDTLWDGLPDSHPLAFRQVHQKLVEIISTGNERNGQSLSPPNDFR
jgi:hypothetical protein